VYFFPVGGSIIASAPKFIITLKFLICKQKHCERERKRKKDIERGRGR